MHLDAQYLPRPNAARCHWWRRHASGVAEAEAEAEAAAVMASPRRLLAVRSDAKQRRGLRSSP